MALTARAQKLRDRMVTTPAICVERLRYMTESYRQTEGETDRMRRAKALAYILEHMTVRIDEDELFVGNFTSKIRGGAIAPELKGQWLLDELDTLSPRPFDRYEPLSREELDILHEYLPYWRGKAAFEHWQAKVPPEYQRLDHIMDIAARSLKTKRTVITKLLEAGLYPYTKRYLGTFGNHFSTIGLIGMNEVGLNAKWLRKDLTHPETQAFAKDVLNHMRERLMDYQEQYGDLYNLEATPAESTTYRFAKHDKEEFPDIITANENGTPYYTNSSHLPVGYTEDIFSALDVQDELQTLYTSGTVFHAFLGEKLPDWKAAAELVRKIAENYKLPYYTMSPTYSVCADHGYLSGEQHTCPICGKPAEVYSRITGYYRPVQNWNDGKTQEFKDRKVYDLTASHLRKAGRAGSQVTFSQEGAPQASGGESLLFTTRTCPNCRQAEALLQRAGVPYQKVVAEESPDLTTRYGVRQAPTLVVQGESITGLGPIKRFAEEHRAREVG